MHRFPTLARTRRHLLCGIPALLVLPASAFAQSAGTAAAGHVVITNDQRTNGSTIQGVIVDPPASLEAGTISSSRVQLSGNAASAGAGGNDHEAVLSTPPLSTSMPPEAAASVVVSRQVMIRSNVLAETTGSGPALSGGALLGSEVALNANLQSSSTLGNRLRAEFDDTSGGIAAITAGQRGETSAVGASTQGATTLSIGDAFASSLGITANRQLSLASGNSADLSLRAGGTQRRTGSQGAALTSGFEGVSDLDASSAIVAQQYWSGPASARIGSAGLPAGYHAVTGALSGALMAINANTMTAAATANQASSDHRADMVSLSGDGTDAASLMSQEAIGPVFASITGGMFSNLRGATDQSTVSASDNASRASATGNALDARLRSRAASLSDSSEAPPPQASAVLEGEVATVVGSYVARTEQRVGTSEINAVLSDNAVTIAIDGPVVESQVMVAGNAQRANATANEAGVDLDLTAGNFRGSTASLLSQSNDANVAARIGSLDTQAGVTIAPLETVQGSLLSIEDNLLEAGAVSSRGANALRLEAATLSDRGVAGGRAGAVGDAFGASGTAVLTSAQKTGQLGTVPLIASEIVGRFSVTGNAPVLASTIEIAGNRQLASAGANSIDNSLAVSSSTVNGATAALASSQYGDASVRASSVMRIVSRGALAASTATLSGNTNQAVAAINTATNRLATEFAAGLAAPVSVEADALGGASGYGSAVLVNTQFAGGQVLALASTLIGGAPDEAGAPSGLSGSRFAVSKNVTAAQASGNEALNLASVDGSGGIATSQMNTASIASAASSSLRLDVATGGRLLASDASFGGNSLAALARGNVAENRLESNGMAAGASEASTASNGFGASATAPVAMVSMQANYGAVSASVEYSLNLPLNLGGPMTAEFGRLGIVDNQTSATAYGNGASNSIAAPVLGGAGVALTNAQSNYGSVTARVITDTATLRVGNAGQSRLGITGNSVSATATGNIATSITGPR